MNKSNSCINQETVMNQQLTSAGIICERVLEKKFQDQVKKIDDAGKRALDIIKRI